MTVERTPVSSRARRWFSSLSKAASASTRAQFIPSAAWVMAGRNCGESLAGPTLTVAAVKKWLAMSQAEVSLIQVWADCLWPARLKKYCEVWRLSRPVPSMAASGSSPMRPPSLARGGLEEEHDDLPFFSNRCWA
jgi:hypothetical protein